MRKAVLFLILVVISLTTTSSNALDFDITNNYAAFESINDHVNDKWSKFTKLQEDQEWLTQQLDLQYYGTIFKKGWLGVKVERQILPGIAGDYVVVDSLVLDGHYIEKLSIIGASFLFKQVMPFLQAAPFKERKFSKLTHVESYEEALTLAHMQVKDIPFNREQFNKLRNGQKINTWLMSGFATRVNLVWLNFIEAMIPGPADLAPKAKLKILKSLDITIEKAQEDIAIITIKNLNELSKGIGTGLSVFLEEIIDLPIEIGINDDSGYSPIVFNLKKRKKKIHEITYRINLASEQGLQAYQKLLEQDFTKVQDLVEEESEDAKMYLSKDGDIKEGEFNWGINFVLWKTGARYIRGEGKFQTTFANGQTLNYEEVTYNKISDHKFFSGKERRETEYKAIIPTTGQHDAFVLDIMYHYQDAKTSGKELVAESESLKARYLENGMRIDFDKKKDYGKVQLYTTVRFPLDTIRELYNVEESELFEAIAVSFDYLDSDIWSTQEKRTSFYKTNTVRRHAGHKKNGHKRLNRAQKTKKKHLDRIKLAFKVSEVFNQLQGTLSAKKKAKLLVNALKDKKLGPVLQRTMVNIVGIDALMGQGYVRGELY